MYRSFMYRLYPTTTQAAELQRQLDVTRELYNACLEERRMAWKMARKSINYYDQSSQLKAIRQIRPDLASVNFSMLQGVCRRVQRAFDGFFRRIKAGQKAGYPRFKSYHRWDSITFLNRARADGAKLLKAHLRIQGVGDIKIKMHRPTEGTLKTLTVKRRCGKWYAMIACDVGTPVPLPATGQSVGIDMGLTHFLTTDTGATVDNPRPMKNAARRLRAAQRALARCKRGSMRRKKARERVAALHGKVANVRCDFHHKTARALVDANDVIAHEDLQVVNMVKNHALAGAIHDAAWGQFLAILAAKAEGAGRQVVAVDPRGTSQTCLCGESVLKTLNDRWHDCPACGLSLPRDQVSAMLIKRLGHSRQALT